VTPGICVWEETNGYCTEYIMSQPAWGEDWDLIDNGPCGYVYLYKLEGHTGFQGIWEPTGDTKNGAFIYKKDLGYYGKWHLWLEWHRYYKAWGWAIGSNPNNYGDWLVFNWGPTLVDSDWIWYRDKAGQWHHDTDATMSCWNLCDGYEDCCCDAAIPPIYAPSNMTNGAEMVSVPPPPGWSADTVSDDDANHEIVAGVAVGALAVVAIVVAMLVIRKKRNGPKSAASVHIPEASQTDIAVQIGTDNETVGSAATGTPEIVTGNEAVEVVEDDVAPKLDEVVNVGQEQ